MRFWYFCEENNIDDFDISTTHYADLKKAIVKSNEFRNAISLKLKNDDFVPTKDDFNKLFTRLSLYEYLFYAYFNYAKTTRALERLRYEYKDWKKNLEVQNLILSDRIYKKYHAPLVSRMKRNKYPKQHRMQRLISSGILGQIIQSEYNESLLRYGILQQTWNFIKYTRNKYWPKETIKTGDILIKCGNKNLLSVDHQRQQVILHWLMSTSEVNTFLIYRPSSNKLLNVDLDSNHFIVDYLQVPILDSNLYIINPDVDQELDIKKLE